MKKLIKRAAITLFFLVSTGDYFCQIIYVSVDMGLKLYKVNVNSCTFTLIASYPNAGMAPGEIAVTPNGRLWGLDASQIFLIDTVNGTRSNPIPCNVASNANSLTDLNDSTLLVNSMTQLFQLNTD